MYKKLLENIKTEVESIKDLTGKKIFLKVSVGATKADDDLSVASIFLENTEHRQLTSFKYEKNVTLFLVCVFNKPRDQEEETFLWARLSEVELIEEWIKSYYELTTTDFNFDSKGFYVMFTFKTNEVR